MPELTDIGKKIILKHRVTGETHWGVIEDVKEVGYVVVMSDTAKIFFDDAFLLLDTEYYADKWQILKVVDDE